MRTVAVVDGFRTPFCKDGTYDMDADWWGAIVVREMVARLQKKDVPLNTIDCVMGSCVAHPLRAPNPIRTASVLGGMPVSIPAYTLSMNCGSGTAALEFAAGRIREGSADSVLVVGMESMSRIRIAYHKTIAELMAAASRAKTLSQKIAAAGALYPKLIQLKNYPPEVGKILGLTDPLCDLIMGLTTENLVRDPAFDISRALQDEYAYFSHKRVMNAEKNGYFKAEIIPVHIPRGAHYAYAGSDNGVRADISREGLAKMKPVFDRRHGSVTIGNSSQITDGAAALLLMEKEKAESLGLPVMGTLGAYADVGFDPTRMGLSPAGAIAKLLKKTKRSLSDFKVVEINEAFAAVVHANWQALDSTRLMKRFFGDQGFGERVGLIPDEALNPNGGAIALGHPVGVTGIRLALTALLELRRRGGGSALTSACVGGGQGVALIVESEV